MGGRVGGRTATPACAAHPRCPAAAPAGRALPTASPPLAASPSPSPVSGRPYFVSRPGQPPCCHPQPAGRPQGRPPSPFSGWSYSISGMAMVCSATRPPRVFCRSISFCAGGGGRAPGEAARPGRRVISAGRSASVGETVGAGRAAPALWGHESARAASAGGGRTCTVSPIPSECVFVLTSRPGHPAASYNAPLLHACACSRSSRLDRTSQANPTTRLRVPTSSDLHRPTPPTPPARAPAPPGCTAARAQAIQAGSQLQCTPPARLRVLPLLQAGPPEVLGKAGQGDGVAVKVGWGRGQRRAEQGGRVAHSHVWRRPCAACLLVAVSAAAPAPSLPFGTAPAAHRSGRDRRRRRCTCRAGGTREQRDVGQVAPRERSETDDTLCLQVQRGGGRAAGLRQAGGGVASSVGAHPQAAPSGPGPAAAAAAAAAGALTPR